MNEKEFEQHQKALEKLIKKRSKAFLYGRTKRMIQLDHQIAQLELELDDFHTIS